MRAGDGEHAARCKYVLADPLRTGDVRQACVQQVFDRRVATRHRIADDDEIRRRCRIGAAEVLGRIAGLQGNAERGELVAHRRVDVLVGSLDRVAEFARERGDATHERAADAQNMQFHAGIFAFFRYIAGAPAAPASAIAAMIQSSAMTTPLRNGTSKLCRNTCASTMIFQISSGSETRPSNNCSGVS